MKRVFAALFLIGCQPLLALADVPAPVAASAAVASQPAAVPMKQKPATARHRRPPVAVAQPVAPKSEPEKTAIKPEVPVQVTTPPAEAVDPAAPIKGVRG